MQAKVYRYIRKLMALPFLPHNEIRPIVCVPQHPCRDPAPPQPDWIYPRAVHRQHHLPPKRLKHIQATDPNQQWHWGVAERSEPPSQWQIQIRVLPVDRTPSSRSLPNFYHHQACIRQEVRRSREKVQATSAETVWHLGPVPDRQQKRFKITALLLSSEWTCS